MQDNINTQNSKPSIPTAIGKRIRFLRNAWKLTTKDLAYILRLKNNSSITKWETIKQYPSLDSFISLSKFFAVSINWLIGTINNPYSSSLICELENELIKITTQSLTPDDKLILPPAYLDENKRIQTYSIENRANTITLLRLIENYKLHHRNDSKQCFRIYTLTELQRQLTISLNNIDIEPLVDYRHK